MLMMDWFALESAAKSNWQGELTPVIPAPIGYDKIWPLSSADIYVSRNLWCCCWSGLLCVLAISSWGQMTSVSFMLDWSGLRVRQRPMGADVSWTGLLWDFAIAHGGKWHFWYLSWTGLLWDCAIISWRQMTTVSFMLDWSALRVSQWPMGADESCTGLLWDFAISPWGQLTSVIHKLDWWELANGQWGTWLYDSSAGLVCWES